MGNGTGARKTNIYLKKFLTQQQMTENFLDYLEEMDRGFFKETFGTQGLFTPVAAQVAFYSSSAVDTFDLFTPLRGTDGLGHLLNLDASQALQIQFENTNSIDYFVGLRFQTIFQETEINVRNGKIKYSFFEEAIGELAEPNSVVDDLDETLTIIVDSIFEVGVSHAGRKVKVWLKEAVNEAGAFEDVTVIWDGSNNLIETVTALGQTTVSGISTDATDYQVFAIGPTVRRNTDLSLDPAILFLGKVEGKGAGNNPDTFDVSGVTQLFSGSTQQLMDSLLSSLVGGGNITWDLATETLQWTSDFKLILPHRSYDFTMSATSIASIADGDALYITKDQVGGVKAITKVTNGNVPNDPNSELIVIRFGDNIFFRGGALELTGNVALIVTGRMGEGLTLENRSLLGVDDLAQFDPDWSGKGAPERYLDPSDNALEATANLEIELNKLFGQLQIIPHESDVTKLRITGVDKVLRDGTILSQTLQNLFMKFDGAVIRLATGAIFEDDDATPLGIDFTPFTIPVTEYFWYGLSLIPGAITADNRIEVQVLVSPATSANAVEASAPFPVLDGNKKLGGVLVQNIAGTVTVTKVKQATELDDDDGIKLDPLLNVTANQVIAGLIFNKLRIKSAIVDFDIHRESDSSNVQEIGKLAVVYDPKDDVWRITIMISSLDDAGGVFNVTSTGQVRISTDDLTGTNYDGQLRITDITRFYI